MAEFLDDVDDDFLLAMQLATEEVEANHTPSKSTKPNNIETINISGDKDLLQAMPDVTEKAEVYHTPPKPTATKNRVIDDVRVMQHATEKAESDNLQKSTTMFNNHDPELSDDEDFLMAVRLSFEDVETNRTSFKTAVTTKNHDLKLSDDEDSLLAMQQATEQVELKYFPKSAVSSRSSGIQNDYKYALQLSNELNRHLSSKIVNKPSTSTSETSINCNDYDSNIESLDQSDIDADYLLAIKLSQMDSPKKNTKSPQKSGNVIQYLDKTMSVVDPSWEVIDPNPDIYALFVAFNKRFFWGRLDMVEVQWSPRMTSCAGICTYHSRAGHCTVRLSVPLLKLRPRKDLIETLLHEMIHAYLFVTKNNRDRDGHGPQFHAHMYRINKESGANITVYHSFHDEVKLYKTHWWKCDGPCQYKPPYYGLVKRSMNRAPGPNDVWWSDHRATCNGQFHKIREPENYNQKKKPKKTEIETKKNVESGIQNFFKFPTPQNVASSVPSTVPSTVSSISDASITKPSSGTSVFGNKKIVTLSDLSKNLNKRSPTKSPKKFVPLPGQKNIIQFVNKS